MPDYRRFSRRPRRLTGYDYRSEGLYFVTLCTKDRLSHFGEVMDAGIVLSDAGVIARDYWLDMPRHHPGVVLGAFVVMPNHIHGIIGLPPAASLHGRDHPYGKDDQQTPLQGSGATKNEYMSRLSPKAASLSRITGSYKTACTRMIRSVCADPFGWQPRFHDRIIRNQRGLENIERYIADNPQNWPEDRLRHP